MKLHFIFLILASLVLMCPAWRAPALDASFSDKTGKGEGQTPELRFAAKHKKPAGGTLKTDIVRYYENASGVNDPTLQDGLRVAGWNRPGRHGAAAPVITSRCLRFAPGEFSRLFIHSPYPRRLRELFVEQGADLGKMANLIETHSKGGKEIVSIFDEGYLVLFDRDEKIGYIFPVGKGMGEKVFSLIQ